MLKDAQRSQIGNTNFLGVFWCLGDLVAEIFLTYKIKNPN